MKCVRVLVRVVYLYVVCKYAGAVAVAAAAIAAVAAGDDKDAFQNISACFRFPLDRSESYLPTHTQKTTYPHAILYTYSIYVYVIRRRTLN